MKAKAEPHALAYPGLLLFISGVAALIFQIIWIKQLTLVVGVEVHAIAAAVSAFFGGLGLGGLIFGRIADRIAQPLRFYAALEATSAIFAIIATLVLTESAPLFTRLEPYWGGFPAWAFVLAVVAIPAIFMGGTIPAMVRAVAQGTKASGAGGGLYAANTLGAIVGALAPAFFLIPQFGVRGSAITAAALYLVAALGALLLDRFSRSGIVKTRRTAAKTTLGREAKIAIALYALAGGVALGYEIVWSQALAQFISTRAFAFSIVLATYLAGLALGAAILARFAPRLRDPMGVFGLLIAGAGLLAFVCIAVLGSWLSYVQTFAEAVIYNWTLSEFAGMCARFAVASICVVLPTTLLLGAAFPTILAVVIDRDEQGREYVGRGVGIALGLNTLGGIIGSIITGFVLIPMLGLIHTLGLLALAAAAIGLVAVFLRKGTAAGLRIGVFGVAIAAIAATILAPADLLARLFPGVRSGTLAFYEESHGGTVAVVETKAGPKQFRRLYIQGMSNSGDAMPSLRYMRLQALLPLIIHNGEPKSALVIGYGTGITAGALSRFPGLEKRVVAELLPAVMRAAPHFKGTYDAASDPGLEVRQRDGRREIQSSDERYDLITLEPPPPSAAGIVNLYSSDFYKLAASRLNQNGLVAQWLPLPTQNEEDTRALIKSFIDVFPYASLWTTELHEMLLVGSMEPINLDAARIAKRFSEPTVAASLAEVGISSPAALLATWVSDRDGLVRFAGDAQAVTDDRPGIEYASWVRREAFRNTLPALIALRSEPPANHADASFLEAMRIERDRLDTFYRAGLAAYAGERTAWAREMRNLSADDGGNPYYRWFTESAK